MTLECRLRQIESSRRELEATFEELEKYRGGRPGWRNYLLLKADLLIGILGVNAPKGSELRLERLL